MPGTIKSTLLRILIIFIINIPVFSGQKTMKCTATVKAGKVSYTINYDDSKKEWAEYIKKMTNLYLKAGYHFYKPFFKTTIRTR